MGIPERKCALWLRMTLGIGWSDLSLTPGQLYYYETFEKPEEGVPYARALTSAIGFESEACSRPVASFYLRYAPPRVKN